MFPLVAKLAAELARPRELSPRVLNYISGHYGIDDDAIGGFLVEKLPTLEDDEIDLILSPVFTPKLGDQAVFAELLGSVAILREQWPGLVQELAARPIRASLVTLDGRDHPVTLREVTIERYVYRLRLDAGVSGTLLELIDRSSAAGDRPMFKAIARQAVWENAGARNILRQYLEAASLEGALDLEDALELLNLVEARKPATVDDLLAKLPAWRESLRQQVETASAGKPFFHDQIREMHGGGRDQRSQADLLQSAKQRELEFLARLQPMLARVN